MSFQVETPIISSPFERPEEHWYLRPGHPPERRAGRRRALVFQPRDQREAWPLQGDHTLKPAKDYERAYELVLVNVIRERVEKWQAEGRPGASRVTQELVAWWRREGRKQRLFFAQLEAAETIIFLSEARPDFLQGIDVPREETGEFARYACKMATGAGKTTVMAMVAAWSILNKVQDRTNKQFSDFVLVVCPNITIKDRLRELDPAVGDASIYRTRDLVPPHLLPDLARGKVLVHNWHLFEPHQMDAGGVSARVVKAGVRVATQETIHIATKTTTARGTRYMTAAAFEALQAGGSLKVLKEERDEAGALLRVTVERERYVESDTALVERIIGRDVGAKQNILIMNDEAHHAYRIRRDEGGDEGLFEGDEEDEFFQEATVWVEGLDRVHKLRGINFCLDLSATPYYLGRVGRQTGRPFPWVVSEFGLIDAIESGLVKIPQLAIRDEGGQDRPDYFNIWDWIVTKKLTPAERGGTRGSPKPEAILKYAHSPIAILAGQWREEFARERAQDPNGRPPVFIIVCKNTAIAKVVHEWLADDKKPTGIPSSGLEEFRNRDGQVNTIRVDTKVVHDTDGGTGEGGGSKADEERWMRYTLDTIGKTDWPHDSQGRALYPDGFEELAKRLERPLLPPGRDVRCIVSVAMLTEGWDASNVTHIVGLRPFMSQLLCEQVVGRGLRRRHYVEDEKGRFTEEVAQVLGVPFEVIPFKAASGGGPTPPVERTHIYAVPTKAQYEVRFPRVDGYRRQVKSRVAVNWDRVAPIVLDPLNIPPEVELAAALPNNKGRMSLLLPGRTREVNLAPYRAGRRIQQLAFEMATDLTRDFVDHGRAAIAAGVLFPQVLPIVTRYVDEKVNVIPPADRLDLFLSPYYGWVIERLIEAIEPDGSAGEAPEVPEYERNRRAGTSGDVDFWTSRPCWEVVRSHINFVVADTNRWEQSASAKLDKNPHVKAFIKNASLGFAIPYLHNGQMHDYLPDFLVRLSDEPLYTMILEVKGRPDPLEAVKAEAAQRWVNAVNAEGSFGRWGYAIVHDPREVTDAINAKVGDVGVL